MIIRYSAASVGYRTRLTCWTISGTASAATGFSYLGAWQPPTIYQTNYWYTKTATITGPYGATITTIQWQLQWNLNNGTYGIPSGLVMKICDAANYCQDITNLTVNGSTSYFVGESASQTFTFKFKIPAAQTVQVGPYIGYAANSWLMENYQY